MKIIIFGDHHSRLNNMMTEALDYIHQRYRITELIIFGDYLSLHNDIKSWTGRNNIAVKVLPNLDYEKYGATAEITQYEDLINYADACIDFCATILDRPPLTQMAKEAGLKVWKLGLVDVTDLKRRGERLLQQKTLA